MLGYGKVLQLARGDLYENPLRAGELVRLRSGGPVMTVMHDGESPESVACVWHTGTGEVVTRDFSTGLLERARKSFFGRRR